jgi:hypothetical protein
MALINGHFYWWHITPHGTAELIPDSPEVSALVDAGAGRYYATIEGAILHAGVLAAAFERETNDTYDALAWLETGAMVRVGSVTITKITASKEA